MLNGQTSTNLKAMKIAKDQIDRPFKMRMITTFDLPVSNKLKFDKSKTRSTKVSLEYHDNLEKSRLFRKCSVPVFHSEIFYNLSFSLCDSS